MSLDFEQLIMWNLRCPKLFKADATKSIELPFNQINDNNDESKQNNDRSQICDIFLPTNLKQQVVL